MIPIPSFANAILLDERVTPELTKLLIAHNWLNPNEQIIALQKPGEGNMNVVSRVITDSRTFILKQARPYVQKYPQVAAPIERIGVEAQFYGLISENETLKTFSPNLIGYDADNFLMALEDLGDGADFTFLYQPDQTLPKSALTALMQFLSALHAIRKNEKSTDFPENRAMRLLNHEHIFSFPFRHDTGFDLDTVQPGLQALSLPYKNNGALKSKIAQLGETYLKSGPTLVHGDFYPGSWLDVSGSTKIIDPEFGFFGRAEFDLGVTLAHLKLAQQDKALSEKALTLYQASPDFDPALMRAFMGTEILRRLLGLAQLPVSLSLVQKETLLEEAAGLV